MFTEHSLCTRHESKYFTLVNYLALSSPPFHRDTVGLPEEEPFQSWRSMALGGRQTCVRVLKSVNKVMNRGHLKEEMQEPQKVGSRNLA